MDHGNRAAAAAFVTHTKPVVALVRPEIPPNTGNIGRTCVGFGARLHLVGTLGFEITDTRLKRAGLDYWPHLDWLQEPDEQAYRASLDPATTVLFTKHARDDLMACDLRPVTTMVFGQESKGLGPDWLSAGFRTVRIPLSDKIRSYNLSNAVAMALFEWKRQQRTTTMATTPELAG